MSDEKYFLLNTDGGMDTDGHRKKGDPPGEAGIGVVLAKVNKNNSRKEDVIKTYGKAIGPADNDVAEYMALIEGLETAIKNGAVNLRAYMDVDWIVDQINFNKTPNEDDLRLLKQQVDILVAEIEEKGSFRLSWIPRGRNAEADRLAQEARRGPS